MQPRAHRKCAQGEIFVHAAWRQLTGLPVLYLKEEMFNTPGPGYPFGRWPQSKVCAALSAAFQLPKYFCDAP